MPQPSFLLGLDLGTSYFKAGVFDRTSGRVRAYAGVRLPIRILENGGREQDVAAIRRVLKRMVRGLKRELGARWNRVSGIGIASQGGSTILVSRAGKAYTPMLLWNDARAQGLTGRVLELLPQGFWKDLTLRGVPPHGLARILWLQENMPELFARTRDVLHVGAGDYLYHMLTGVWRQEAGSALQIGPYNVRARQLDARPLEALGLSLDFVPPLRDGHSTRALSVSGASLLELPSGIPVAGPYIDQEAGFRAAAAAVDSPLHVSLGTAWVGNFQIADKRAGDSPYQLVLPADKPTERLVVLPLLTGNAAWEWALREFVGGAGAKALANAKALLGRLPFPHAGLCVLPWHAQENPLQPGAYGGGAVVGMNTNTTKEDLLSATAVGLVLELGRAFAALRDSGAIQNVVLSGGASNGEHFQRLIAALMAPLPVWQADSDLAGARGALCGFGGKAPRTALKRVPMPTGPFRREALERASEYERIIQALYGHVPAGRPYESAHA